MIGFSLGSFTYVLLNSYKRFFLAAFGNALWKFAVVAALIMYSSKTDEAMAQVLIGGLVGGILAASIVGMPSTYGNERYDRSKALISLVMTAAIAFVSLKPIVTADLLRPILPPAAQWLDNRVGGYFTPLRPVGFGLYWYSPSLNQWSPAGKVVMALSNGWVDLGVFWRWETGIGETGIIPYSVTWRAIEGSRGQTLHVDEDTVTQVDANKAMIYRRSAQRLFPGTYEIVVEVAGRNVARRRVTVR